MGMPVPDEAINITLSALISYYMYIPSNHKSSINTCFQNTGRPQLQRIIKHLREIEEYNKRRQFSGIVAATREIEKHLTPKTLYIEMIALKKIHPLIVSSILEFSDKCTNRIRKFEYFIAKGC